MEVVVLEKFYTSLGIIATLDFPKPLYPKITMELIKDDVVYVIRGIQFESPNHFGILDGRLYNCLLSENAKDLVSGDVLTTSSKGRL